MKTILAAIDFSPVSRDVVDHAVALSRAVDGRVTVLHAVEPPAIATDLTSVVGEALRLMAEVERTSRRQLQRMQRRWAERGVTVEVMCRQGFPVPLIAAVAKQLEADYIVLGSHGHSALHDLVAGSTTNGVLKRADCPVVVVPARLARPELRPRKMPAARRRRKEVT